MARKPTDTVQLNLRFSEALRRRLERAAKNNDCSLNAEIVDRLEKSFDLPELTKAVTAAVRMVLQEKDIWKYATEGMSPSDEDAN
jgi:hypothetical protein